MELMKDYVSHQFVDPLLPDQLRPWLGHESMARTFAIYWTIMTIGGYLVYFACASTSYLFLFYLFPNPAQHREHKPHLVRGEIAVSLIQFPVGAFLHVPFIMMDEFGYGYVYKDVAAYGWGYLIVSIIWFIIFTDCCIYWIHYGLHVPPFYAWFHKTHHSFRETTPFASHAFHPVDGFLQGFPYHLFIKLFPMHHIVWVLMLGFVNLWTVNIHDQVKACPGSIVNGARHHTQHHIYFKYNYGQYFTFWDKVMGTYLEPGAKPPSTTEKIQ